MGDQPVNPPAVFAVIRTLTPTMAALAVFAALSFASSASAALGDSAASVEKDSAALNASPASATSMPSFVRHEMRTADGTQVREFASPSHGVFAVDFSGPVLPDLKTLLGTHYDSYLVAAKARRGINHHFLSFEKDGLAVRIVKLPRGFEGRALLPAALPAGVGPGDLQ